MNLINPFFGTLLIAATQLSQGFVFNIPPATKNNRQKIRIRNEGLLSGLKDEDSHAPISEQLSAFPQAKTDRNVKAFIPTSISPELIGTIDTGEEVNELLSQVRTRDLVKEVCIRTGDHMYEFCIPPPQSRRRKAARKAKEVCIRTGDAMYEFCIPQKETSKRKRVVEYCLRTGDYLLERCFTRSVEDDSDGGGGIESIDLTTE